MKSSHWGMMLVAVGLLIGWLVENGSSDVAAKAQAAPPAVPALARFQISAWGMGYPQPPSAASGKGERGCYIVDTVTGELWHAAADGKPTKISEALR